MVSLFPEFDFYLFLVTFCWCFDINTVQWHCNCFVHLHLTRILVQKLNDLVSIGGAVWHGFIFGHFFRRLFRFCLLNGRIMRFKFLGVSKRTSSPCQTNKMELLFCYTLNIQSWNAIRDCKLAVAVWLLIGLVWHSNFSRFRFFVLNGFYSPVSLFFFFILWQDQLGL